MDTQLVDQEYQNQTNNATSIHISNERRDNDVSEITERMKVIAKSYDEAKQASNSTKLQGVELSNQLIITMHTFLRCGGLEITGCSKFSAYISNELSQFKASLSSIYHYGEVAEFCSKNNIEPSQETIPPVRAITRVKQKIRDKVWEESKRTSGKDIPSVKDIKHAATKLLNGLVIENSNTKTGVAYKQTYELLEKADLSIEKLQQMQLRVNEMQKAHENDEFGFLKLLPDELGHINEVIRYLITTHPERDKNSESEFSVTY